MGFTALIIAAARNSTDLCKLLLDHGAQIDIKDKVCELISLSSCQLCYIVR